MESPFFCLDGQMGPCSPHVDEGKEDVGDAGFGGIQNSLDKSGELLVPGGTGGRASPRSGGEPESVVDGLRSLFDDRRCREKTNERTEMGKK